MSIKTILLATDLEPESDRVIDYAFELGERLGAVVHAVHAFPVIVVPNASGWGSIPYEALHVRATERLSAATARHASSPSRGKGIVDLGDPTTIILEMTSALRADMIIVGTHAPRGMQRVWLGSVAEAVLRGAPVPVLVIKTPKLLPQRSARESSEPHHESEDLRKALGPSTAERATAAYGSGDSPGYPNFPAR